MEREDIPRIEITGVSGNQEETAPLIANGDYHEANERHVPKDKYYSVFAVFALVGMTTLLPWNFFISLNNFWDYKFRDVNKTNSNLSGEKTPPTELQQEFTSYLAISSTIPNAIFVIINAFYGQRFDLQKRLNISLSVMIVAFTAVTALAFANTDNWQRTFLIVTLCLVVIINMNSAIFQGGSFGMAGKFPAKYMSAQMIGQAVGGVFPALVDIIIVSLKIKEEDVGAVCFAIATLVLLICLISLIWVLRTPFFLYYYEQNPEEAEESSETNEASDENIFKISWIYLVSIVLTFSITLTIFPSVAVLVQSEISNPKSAWATKYFTPVSVFLLFNFGDLTGRSLASWINMPGPTTLGKIILLLASVGRLAFIPLFLYCNIVTEKSQGHDPLFQRSQILFLPFGR